MTAAPPVVFVLNPDPGATFTEGSVATFRAGSLTADGYAQGDFTWTHEGATVAATREVSYTLDQVGLRWFEVELLSHGMTATASVSVTVVADYDRDGMPNDWELAYQLNPLDARDAHQDADNDALTNWEEYSVGSNPRVADTDGDGRNDGQEVQEGTNPNIPDQAPPANPEANDPPVAVADAVTTLTDTAITIQVLTNDSDPNDDPLAVYTVDLPPVGEADTDGATVVYTPPLAYTGVVTFSYGLTDWRGGNTLGSIVVTVGGSGSQQERLFMPKVHR